MAVRRFARGFMEGFKGFGESVSLVVNSFLLLFVYLAGIGPTSLLGKITGKNFLPPGPESGRDTYWSSHNLDSEPVERYRKQY